MDNKSNLVEDNAAASSLVAPVSAVVDETRKQNTALPAWLNENLPQWFRDRPGTTEALWQAGNGLVKQFYVIIAAFFASADTIHVTDYWAYAMNFHWWPFIFTTIILPALKARTAYVKAKTP